MKYFKKIFNISHISVHEILLIIILLIGIGLRLQNFPNRISMGLDSARDAFVALEGAKYLQFPLTGPFISIAPVTTGPWYWIQLIIAKIIFQTSYAPWIIIAVYSILMIFIMFKIGESLEGKSFGLILASVTAFSPNQISNSVGLTNPAVIGFYSSLLIFFCISRYLLKKSNNGWLCLGVIVGITVNTHYQSVGLLSFPIIIWILKYRNPKLLLKFFTGILITFIPLIIFELNNHWYNTGNMIEYLKYGQYRIYVPMSWTIFIKDFWPNYISYVFGGNKLFGLLIICATVFIFFIKLIKKQFKQQYLIIVLSFIIQLVIIRYYRGEKYFGYLQFFHPYLIIFNGLVIYYIFKLRFGLILGSLCVLFYLFNILASVQNTLIPEALSVDTIFLSKKIVENFGDPPYKLYKCNKLVKPEVRALSLVLEMNGWYDSIKGKPIAYFWGCNYPLNLLNGRKLTENDLNNAKIFYPGFEFIRDFSQASESAILDAGWIESSPMKEYQSAARWWMDEQP